MRAVELGHTFAEPHRQIFIVRLKTLVWRTRAVGSTGRWAAHTPAEDAFLRADQDLEEFERFEISVGDPLTVEDYTQALTEQIREGVARVLVIVDRYEEIRARSSPYWSLAADVQQARAYSALAHAIRNAPIPFVLPAAIRERL